MIDPAIVLFANDAFYLAFNNQDLEAMNELWASKILPVCIHPGWAPMFSRSEIMSSWEEIFNQDQSQPRVSCHLAKVISQESIQSVVCYEKLPNGWVVATNNFILEDGKLKIFHHQASHCMNPPDVLEEKPETLQ